MTDFSQLIECDVSRETEDKLRLFLELLEKWTPKINLVASNTVKGAWTRHFVDSGQIYKHKHIDRGVWVDFGSGGGFPGLVCAVIAKQNNPEISFLMIESDARKAAFLRTVIRELDLSASVLVQRIEKVEPLKADIISARALASVKDLLPLANIHLKPDGKALFLKGEKWEEEVSDATSVWKFSVTPHQSKTNAKAAILEIGDICHV